MTESEGETRQGCWLVNVVFGGVNVVLRGGVHVSVLSYK
jgi:hypothetical protein